MFRVRSLLRLSMLAALLRGSVLGARLRAGGDGAIVTPLWPMPRPGLGGTEEQLEFLLSDLRDAEPTLVAGDAAQFALVSMGANLSLACLLIVGDAFARRNASEAASRRRGVELGGMPSCLGGGATGVNEGVSWTAKRLSMELCCEEMISNDASNSSRRL